jgi:ADP-ribosylglycohydrolase
MRTSPMALWYYHELTQGTSAERAVACEHIRTMSRVTHHHPHAVEACVIYAVTLADLLRDPENPVSYRSYERVVDTAAARECHLYQRVCSFVEDPHYVPYDPGAFPARGTAEFSLVVALKVLTETRSFAAGIEYAIRVGGDTDTYGAIAGGLLGARYGFRSIPTAWKEGILGKQVMKDMARKIYDRRINPPRRGL